MRHYQRVVFLPDVHIPYQHDPAIDAAIELIQHVQPAIVVQLGDLVDFYALSRFSKDPARQLTLQAELDSASRLLCRIRNAAPNARLIVLQGNHEHRLTRYLWDRAPELSGLRGMRIETLLELSKIGAEYVGSGMYKLSQQVIAKHGHFVRNRSAYTASAELERLWCSGVSGHTHRIGQVYRTTAGGAYTWMETGCLCDLAPEYMEGQVADWQHGIGYAEIAADRYWMTPLPILSGRVVWGATELGRKKSRRSPTRTSPTSANLPEIPESSRTRSPSSSKPPPSG